MGELLPISTAEASDVHSRRLTAPLQELDASEAEVDLHAAIAQEYAPEVSNLNRDIRSISGVMRQLADETAVQGEQLDSIESMMAQAADSTTGATVEIGAAQRNQ